MDTALPGSKPKKVNQSIVLHSQMLGLKCLDVNTVTTVHVSTKSTIGNSEGNTENVL